MLFTLVLLLSAYASNALNQSNEKVEGTISGLASEYVDKFVQASTCGGVLKDPSGVINYKLGVKIMDFEICVWTVVLPTKSHLEIQLVEDGFEWGQNIRAFNIDNSGLFDFAFSMHKDDRLVRTVIGTAGPVFQIVFTSSTMFSEETVTGFLLRFKEVGENQYPEPDRYKIFDQVGPTGAIRYPEVGDVYPKYQNILLTLHSEEGKRVALSLESYSMMNNWSYDYSFCSTESTNANFIVSEVAYGFEFGQQHVVRFNECRNTTSRTTIYSPLPLVIQYGTEYDSYGNIQMSWEMVD